MGPNLRKLFEGRADSHYPVGGAEALKINELFQAHGEALIAALEGVLDPKNHGGFTLANERARTLLAQLESEAQP